MLAQAKSRGETLETMRLATTFTLMVTPVIIPQAAIHVCFELSLSERAPHAFRSPADTSKTPILLTHFVLAHGH